MTNAELIAKIRAEIEKRLEQIIPFVATDTGSTICELKGLLSFLNTLEEPVCEELNEEIKRMMAKMPLFVKGKDQIAFARHFAEWGAEHLKK
jgi:hypothetical protein